MNKEILSDPAEEKNYKEWLNKFDEAAKNIKMLIKFFEEGKGSEKSLKDALEYSKTLDEKRMECVNKENGFPNEQEHYEELMKSDSETAEKIEKNIKTLKDTLNGIEKAKKNYLEFIFSKADKI